MKKTFLTIAAALFMCVPSFSQQAQKVDVAGMQKKIEKSDADIANPKKAAKAATWLNRGKVLMDAETAYSSQVYDNMDGVMATLLFGQPKTTEEVKLGDVPYTRMSYNAIDIYSDANKKIKAWEITKPVYEGALDKAVEAYNKAYELDPKSIKKTKEGFSAIVNSLAKQAGSNYTLRKYKEAADAFERAFEVSLMPAAAMPIDTMSIYNAGYSAYFAGDYARSCADLFKAEELGYYQDGELYNVLYNSFRSLNENNKTELAKAKDFLLRGLQRFPGNANIITCFTDLYLALGENPEDVVPMVQAAIEKEPDNAMLWYGLGSIYKALNRNADALDAFNKVAELNPKNAAAYYYIGYLYVAQGDALSEEVNKMPWTGRENYDKEYQKVLDLYAKSIEPFEKAHELMPQEVAFVEYLKVVTFRLRDMSPEIQAKFEKYNEIYKQMTNQQ